jgi:hypothetical protein
MFRRYQTAALATAAIVLPVADAAAHGFAGDRFFPATIQTDDPFVADEMSLLTATKNPTSVNGTQSYSLESDISKRITQDTDFTLAYQWNYFQPSGMQPHYGWGTLTTGVQYQLFINAPHEAMGLLGLDVSWGHTGAVVGGQAANYTTISPTFDFGKGLGDLPEWLPWIRPFAITGNIFIDFPTKVNDSIAPGCSPCSLNQTVFNAGFAIEYSLEYLQHHVRDVGIGHPFDRMVPLVEITTATPLNRGFNSDTGMTNLSGYATTGLIAPGVIWAGQYYQLAAEAIFPYGEGSGHGVGGLIQFHLFLDDLFPHSIGQPIFGTAPLNRPAFWSK